MGVVVRGGWLQSGCGGGCRREVVEVVVGVFVAR